MNRQDLIDILRKLDRGDASIDETADSLTHLPFEDIGIACIDQHRAWRQGVPEVIFGEHKTTEQLRTILSAMSARGGNILLTRVAAEKAKILADEFPQGEYDRTARTFVLEQKEIDITGRGTILVVCAGTSDLPVAREAAVTARLLGNRVEELVDVGVAGIHRLLSQGKKLTDAAVIIVVSGMEGALPSVIGGLVAVPVIAVPTSVGYGAAFGGVAALLGMLNSCAGGITVVNIDNGFGAAFAATRINRRPTP